MSQISQIALNFENNLSRPQQWARRLGEEGQCVVIALHTAAGGAQNSNYAAIAKLMHEEIFGTNKGQSLSDMIRALWRWNDTPGRTFDEVRSVVQRTVARVLQLDREGRLM